MTPPDYPHIQQLLVQARSLAEAAEAHGTLTGCLCATAGYRLEDWLREILPEAHASPEIAAALEELFAETAAALLQPDMEFEPLLPPAAAIALASAIVWFDAYTTNVDRTARNTNMLVHDRQLWLIDHGAALYVHHTWASYIERSRSPFPQVKDHVLLPYADALAEADIVLSPLLTPDLLHSIVALIPDNAYGSVVEAAQGKVGNLVDQVLLYCFHYDPTTGKYSLMVLNIMRAGGLATVVGLLSFWLVMFRENRKRGKQGHVEFSSVS